MKPEFCQLKNCHVRGVDTCHILTRGAYPQYKNESWNLMYFCREHHLEQHQLGWVLFADKYNLKKELYDRGFYYCHVSQKWKYPEH